MFLSYPFGPMYRKISGKNSIILLQETTDSDVIYRQPPFNEKWINLTLDVRTILIHAVTVKVSVFSKLSSITREDTCLWWSE